MSLCSSRNSIAIVVVNYRTAALSIDCLDSLSKEVTTPGSFALELVDNASPDDSADRLESAIRHHDWGGWGRNRVYNDEGNTGSVTDSHWMIILGVYGMIGLLSHFLIFAIPGFFFLSHFGPKTWDNSWSRLEFPLAIVLLLYSIDNLFNAFPNSMFPMFAGGLSCMGRRSGNSDQYDELAGT